MMSVLLESRDEQIWMREMKKMLVFIVLVFLPCLFLLSTGSLRLENSNEYLHFTSAADALLALLLESRDEQIWIREIQKCSFFVLVFRYPN